MSAIFDRMTALAECVCAALAEIGMEDLCYCGVMPGEEIDYSYLSTDCDNCGMAWVRLTALYPSVSLGQSNITPVNCGTQIGIDLEVGALFCVGVGDSSGGLPSPEDLFEATEKMTDAANAIFRAINCCDGIGDYVIGQWVPVGPQGGAVGGVWPLSLMDV